MNSSLKWLLGLRFLRKSELSRTGLLSVAREGTNKASHPYQSLAQEPSSPQIAPARFPSVDKTSSVSPGSNDRDIRCCVFTRRKGR